MIFDPTWIEQSVLGQIRQSQSGGRYNVLWGGNTFTGGYAAFPRWAGRMGPSGMSHAAGAFQYEPETWADVAKAIGAEDFSPANQDIGALYLLREQGQRPWACNFADDGRVYLFAATLENVT